MQKFLRIKMFFLYKKEKNYLIFLKKKEKHSNLLCLILFEFGDRFGPVFQAFDVRFVTDDN